MCFWGMGVSMYEFSTPVPRSIKNEPMDAGGDRLADIAEQEALLKLLDNTKKRHSLSTANTQLQPKEAWALEDFERMWISRNHYWEFIESRGWNSSLQ